MQVFCESLWVLLSIHETTLSNLFKINPSLPGVSDGELMRTLRSVLRFVRIPSVWSKGSGRHNGNTLEDLHSYTKMLWMSKCNLNEFLTKDFIVLPLASSLCHAFLKMPYISFVFWGNFFLILALVYRKRSLKGPKPSGPGSFLWTTFSFSPSFHTFYRQENTKHQLPKYLEIPLAWRTSTLGPFSIADSSLPKLNVNDVKIFSFL